MVQGILGILCLLLISIITNFISSYKNSVLEHEDTTVNRSTFIKPDNDHELDKHL